MRSRRRKAELGRFWKVWLASADCVTFVQSRGRPVRDAMAPEAAPPADTAKPIPVVDEDAPAGPDKYGSFSNPGSLNVGVPYTGKDPLAQGNSRLRGVNMKAPSAKMGKGNDASFDRFKPLYQKEPFQVSAAEKREARAKAEDGRIQGPLVPAGDAQKEQRSGRVRGHPRRAVRERGRRALLRLGHRGRRTAQGLDERRPEHAAQAAKHRHGSGQEGWVRMRGYTLGEKKSAGGSAGEYKYVATDYDAERKADAARAAHGKKLMAGKPDWKPTAPGKRGGPGSRARRSPDRRTSAACAASTGTNRRDRIRSLSRSPPRITLGRRPSPTRAR